MRLLFKPKSPMIQTNAKPPTKKWRKHDPLPKFFLNSLSPFVATGWRLSESGANLPDFDFSNQKDPP